MLIARGSLRQTYQFAAVFETRVLSNERLVAVSDPVKIEVLTGPGRLYKLSNGRDGRAVLPPPEPDVEYSLPQEPPIEMQPGLRYIIVSARAKTVAVEEQESCRRYVERAIGFLSAIYGAELFASRLYLGWLAHEPSGQVVQAAIMFTSVATWDRRAIESSLGVVRRVLASEPAMRERFDLVARLFAHAVALPPSDDTLLWLWTCLEVFPMLGQEKYRVIADYLEPHVSRSAAEIAEALDIRGFHELRSKLVHSGGTRLRIEDLYLKLSRLQRIVLTVMRCMCGLPYDGRLDDLLTAAKTE